VASRQARILRLLAEAQAQGASPTEADLACALGVSERTIKRDIAALWQEGGKNTEKDINQGEGNTNTKELLPEPDELGDTPRLES
jgi:predicted DNA-binding transcriptional regulator YafY